MSGRLRVADSKLLAADGFDGQEQCDGMVGGRYPAIPGGGGEGLCG